jgi:hypothetical protein
MIKNFYIIITIIFMIISSVIFSQGKVNYVQGELLIMLQPEATVSQFNKLMNTNFSGIEFTVKSKISKRMNIWLVSFNQLSYSTPQALEISQSSNLLISAQFNHSTITLRGDTCPIDSGFNLQYNFRNIGQSGGVIGADIAACEAWGLGTNTVTSKGDTVVVAVIDDGFYLAHQDIDFFKNYNEIPNNGIDDDGNGYVDDYQGWNSRDDTSFVNIKRHGTLVSGIIGAKADSVGVVGVNWGMKILPIQGSSSIESDVLKAYDYVLEMRSLYDSTNGAKGAYVVATNSSFGVDYANRAAYPLWCSFYDSLGAKGILSVAATANLNLNVDVSGDIPTTCESDFLISATNTNRFDGKYNQAAYGALSIDIGAPGTNILSTVPYLSIPYSTNFSYGTGTGTSFSSPHVAGAVAFLFANACDTFLSLYQASPDSMALQIKKMILEQGDSIFALQGITTTGKRLNIYQSMLAMINSNFCVNTSVNNINLNQNLEILLFPNPNQGDFTLKIENSKQGKYQLSIISIEGKLIEDKQLIINKNSEELRIDINKNLDQGIYFLCFKSPFGFTKNIKFVVSK